MIFCAAALTIGIFILFPLTQYIGSQSRDLVQLRSVDVAPPPLPRNLRPKSRPLPTFPNRHRHSTWPNLKWR